MKNVIVTGANGFIGSSLIKVLVDKGIRITAIDVNFSASRLPESELITKIESSVGATLVDKIPAAEYDAFYHLAWRGVNGSEKADPFVQLANIQMAIDCADVCKELNCNKFLCAGTVAEQSTNSLPNLQKTSEGMMYGVAKHCTHLMLETYCKNIGLPLVWMQFSNIYGIGNITGNLVSYTLGEILNGKDATFGPALQPYDFIYIDDLVQAVYRLGACNTKHTLYYLGSGNPHILKEYLLRIGELAGCKELVKFDVRPDDGIRYTMDMFDNSNLVEDIGGYKTTSFDEGIKKTINWLKSL